MKSLLIVLLIVALMLPMSAIAEDRDPIVGQWYCYLDVSETPELASNYTYEKTTSIYDFLEDGTVMCLELNLQNGSGTPAYYAAGKWEKKDSAYEYNILYMGEGTIYIEDDCLYISIPQSENIYLRLRKMVIFNAYQDYVLK